MHEHIKYTVKLSHLTEPYRVGDSLSRKEKGDWQAICSEVTYGTHYLIYSKFIGNFSGDGKKFNVDKIQFYLQNYTGLITMGFEGSPFIFSETVPEGDPDYDKDEFPGRKRHYVVLPIQGLNENDMEDNFGPTDLEIKADDLLQVVSLFHPMEHIREGTTPNGGRHPIFVDPLVQMRIGELHDDTVGGQERKDLLELYKNLTDEKFMQFYSKHRAARYFGTKEVATGIQLPCEPINSIFVF